MRLLSPEELGFLIRSLQSVWRHRDQRTVIQGLLLAMDMPLAMDMLHSDGRFPRIIEFAFRSVLRSLAASSCFKAIQRLHRLLRSVLPVEAITDVSAMPDAQRFFADVGQ